MPRQYIHFFFFCRILYLNSAGHEIPPGQATSSTRQSLWCGWLAVWGLLRLTTLTLNTLPTAVTFLLNFPSPLRDVLFTGNGWQLGESGGTLYEQRLLHQIAFLNKRADLVKLVRISHKRRY